MEIKHGPARSGGRGEKKDDEETLIAIEGSGGDCEPAPASSWAVFSITLSAYHHLIPTAGYVYGTLIYIWFCLSMQILESPSASVRGRNAFVPSVRRRRRYDYLRSTPHRISPWLFHIS
jgi:hypothetical protein